MATYEFIRQRTDGYREKGGASALTLAKTGQSIHRIHAGAEVSWEAPQGVRVAAQGWYRGIYGDVRSETPTYFTADPERHMFVNTSHKADRNSVGLGARLAIPLGTRAELGAEYALMLGTNSVSHQGSAVIGIGW